MVDQNFLEVEKENKNNPNKNIITIIVLVALVGVALLGWLTLTGERPKAPESKTPESEVSIEVSPGILLTKTPNREQAPSGFPDVPLNGKIKVNNSYSLAYQNSNSEQKVIDFTSSKSVEENFAFYKSWAEKNEWNILHKLDNPKESRLIVEKDKKPLNIVIQKDAEASSKVNMSW